MGDLINLRQARKRRERDRAAATAQENRIRFGRTNAERAKDSAARDDTRRAVDAAALDAAASEGDESPHKADGEDGSHDHDQT